MNAGPKDDTLNTRPKIARAISWSAIDVLGRAGLGFLVLIVLARLLDPADFGLMAMLAIFVGLSGLLVDSGFNQALVQRQDTTIIDESTIFFFTVAMGAAIAVLLAATGHFIARFYGQPILTPMTRWMALALFLNSLGSIHTTLLTRLLDFRTISRIGIVSALLSSTVAILVALGGFGVWALVAQTVTTSLSTVLLLWLLHNWRPKLVFSFASLRSLFRFGGYVLLTGLLYTVRRHFYALLIGRVHPASDVGHYSQAQRIQELPVVLMNNVVGRVAFPAFSASANNHGELVAGMRRAIISQMFILAPLVLGFVVLAEPFTEVLLGEKWLRSAPVLQVLAFIGLFWPLSVLNATVIKSVGHAKLHAQIQLATFFVAIVLLLIAAPHGIVMIAGSQGLAAVVTFFVHARFTGKLIGYGGAAQLRDLLPYVAAALPLLVSAALVRLVLDTSPGIELLCAAGIGGGAYGVTCILARVDALTSLAVFMRSNATISGSSSADASNG